MPTIAVLVAPLVDEREFYYPYYRFQEAGFDVVVASPGGKSVTGKGGLTIPVDAAIDDLHAEQLQALYIPGGFAPDYLRREESALHLVRAMVQNNKIVAAICHGPWVLISAGVVQGKRITGFFSIADDLRNAGAIYTGQPVEVDLPLITATRPTALPQFMIEVLHHLND